MIIFHTNVKCIYDTARLNDKFQKLDTIELKFKNKFALNKHEISQTLTMNCPMFYLSL